MVEVVPFRLEEISEVLKNKVKESNVFKDIDYEGSNISILIGLLSTAARIVNMNTTFGINEMILADATQRDNILKVARNLGYEAIRKRSAEYEITLVPALDHSLWPTDSLTFIIPKYTKFLSSDGLFCYYMGEDIERTISKYDMINSNDNSKIIIKVKEGILLTYKDNQDLNYTIGTYIDNNGELKTETSILILEDDIEEDGIEVFVTSSDDINVYFQSNVPTMANKGSLWVQTENSNGFIKDISLESNIYIAKNDGSSSIMKGEWEFLSTWKNATNSIIKNFKNNPLMDINAIDPMKNRQFTKRNYFVIDDEIDNNKDTFLPLMDFDTNYVRVYFRYAQTGITLYPGTQISINVLKSSGSKGNNITSLSIFDSILQNQLTFEKGSLPRLISVGKDEETNEEIKQNAPIFYNTANRAVTAKDYQVISERRTEVQRAIVWGGEQTLEKTIGEVNLSFLSSVTSNILDKFSNSNNTYKLIVNDIYNNNNIALEPNSDVYYDSKFFLSEGNINDILKYLENFKIMTMRLKHTNPIFVDVDYKIKVLGYVGDRTKTQTSIFNIINSYFKTDLNIFEAEYFESVIIRLISNQLGNISGVNLNSDFSIVLSTGNMIADGKNSYFQFYLESPFENIFDNSSQNLLIQDNLPSINTIDFIKDVNNSINSSLIVDYTRVKHTIDKNVTYEVNKISKKSELDVLPIVFDGQDVGMYIIHNSNTDSENYIRVDLWLNDNTKGDDVYSKSTLLKSYFSQPQKIRLSNKSNNFRFMRNMIPRLNSIQFI